MCKFNIIIHKDGSECRLTTGLTRIDAERLDEFLSRSIGASNVYVVPSYEDHVRARSTVVCTYSIGFSVRLVRLSSADGDKLCKVLDLESSLIPEISKTRKTQIDAPMLLLHRYRDAEGVAYFNHKRIQAARGDAKRLRETPYNFRANASPEDSLHRVL